MGDESSMKITVSLYVEEKKWSMCKELGFNMSSEVELLMDMLVSTSLLEDDPSVVKAVGRKHRLEKEMKLVDKRRAEMEEEYVRVSEQEKVYQMKLAQIEDNKEFSKRIREFNKVIVRNDYSLKRVMLDPETAKHLVVLSEYETIWTETKVLQQINRVRKFMEGF